MTKDRSIHALVLPEGAYKDHPLFEGYMWEKPNRRHVEFTVALDQTGDVQMQIAGFREVVRNTLISSIGARMDPPPDGAKG